MMSRITKWCRAARDELEAKLKIRDFAGLLTHCVHWKHCLENKVPGLHLGKSNGCSTCFQAATFTACVVFRPSASGSHWFAEGKGRLERGLGNTLVHCPENMRKHWLGT